MDTVILPHMKKKSDDVVGKLFQDLKGKVDAVLIVNSRSPFLDENFQYFTDVRGGVFEGSFALVTKTQARIITSKLEEGIAKKSGCNVDVYSTAQQRDSLIRSRLRGKEVVGINEAAVSIATMKRLRKILRGKKFKDVSVDISNCRAVKSKREIGRLKKAASIASKTAEEIPEILRVGMTEKEAAAEVDYLLRCNGADGPAFETVVAFGSSSALPHYMAGERRLTKGSVALFDFGALYWNYRSDISRTYFTKPLNTRMTKIYKIVLSSQEAAIKKISPGIRASEIDTAARTVIEKGGFGRNFIHSTGHGIGIAVHDSISISERSTDVLKENMAFTVEPGIYVPRLGGVRIEDDVVVTARGCRVITDASRQMIVI